MYQCTNKCLKTNKYFSHQMPVLLEAEAKLCIFWSVVEWGCLLRSFTLHWKSMVTREMLSSLENILRGGSRRWTSFGRFDSVRKRDLWDFSFFWSQTCKRGKRLASLSIRRWEAYKGVGGVNKVKQNLCLISLIFIHQKRDADDENEKMKPNSASVRRG